MLVVADLTGSMYVYTAQLLLWFKIKEAAKELAKEEKEKLKKLREDAMAKGKAAKIMSGTGGQIRNY